MADTRDTGDIEDVGRTWVSGAGALVAVIGLFIAAMPGLTGDRGIALWNDALIGLLLVGLGVFTVWTTARRRPRRAVWPGRIIAVLGLWVGISPFLVGASLAYLLMNLFMMPFIIVLGGYIASKAPEHFPAATRRGRAA